MELVNKMNKQFLAEAERLIEQVSNIGFHDGFERGKREGAEEERKKIEKLITCGLPWTTIMDTTGHETQYLNRVDVISKIKAISPSPKKCKKCGDTGYYIDTNYSEPMPSVKCDCQKKEGGVE